MSTAKNKARFGAQVSYNSASGNSTFQAFSAVIPDNAAIMIFDNQSDTAVTISDNGTTSGKTFAAGSALVLDLRANVGKEADDLTFRDGIQFYASSSAGTGSFYISWVYAS